MKKLMIAAAIVCAAALSQAASFTWQASGDSKDWADAYVGETAELTAYLYLGTVSATDSAFVFGDAKLLASGGQNGDWTFGSSGAKVSSANLSSDEAGQAYTIILAETAGGDLASYEGHYAILSGESGHGVNPMDAGDHWATFNNNQILTQGDWGTMSAVPEPTSGLLLLLGVAGRALRRRRA